MKQTLSRLLALCLALSLVLGLLPAQGFAVQTGEHPTGKIYVEHPGSTALTDAYLSAPQAVQPQDDLPEYYNSTNEGYVTAVRNQGSYGTCWAHGAIASIESYMIKHGIVNGATGEAAAKSMNLSEYHLSWYNYTYAYDALDMLKGDLSKPYSNYLNLGGNGEMATYTLMRWEGPASETTSALAYSNAKVAGLGSAYAYQYNIAHVQGVDWIPTMNMNAIKHAIMTYGAGTFGYCHEDYYSNDSTGAYCWLG